jgi:hypothetical protein
VQGVQVSAAEAKSFGKVWTHNGVAIFMDDTHYQFAADFANIVLKSFVDQAQRAAVEAAKKRQIVIANE